MADTAREQETFEAWARVQGLKLTKSHDGTYVYRPAYYAWMGWQAANQSSDADALRRLTELEIKTGGLLSPESAATPEEITAHTSALIAARRRAAEVSHG